MKNVKKKCRINLRNDKSEERVKRVQCALTHPPKNEGVIAKKMCIRSCHWQQQKPKQKDKKTKNKKERRLDDVAIFHMNFTNISAGNGRSAVASASYRSGEKLHSDMENKNYFYDRTVMPESFILLPENAPEWASDRERLWNEVEAVDRKVNSRYAKEFNVALPVELSNDEQKKLLTDYVQSNFVDDGMVADIAIHRDHEDNPHAHVMLTSRPFNEDGTWGMKSKKEYILDEQGNKTYTEKGNVRSYKTWLVDWDKKGKVQEWRTAWANAVNRTFEEKNMPDRISENTLEEQGIDGFPTEHVGVNYKREERQEYNKLVMKNRTDRARLKGIEDKIANERRARTLQKHLSFNEKKVIAGLSKELHTFVNLESLDEKQRMLFNWKNSILIKRAVGEDITNQLLKFNEQKFSLENANRLMDKVVDRTIKSIYPTIDTETVTMAEKRELIKETDNEQRIFNTDELTERLDTIRADILNKQILTFTNRPFKSWLILDRQEKHIKKNIENIIEDVGYSYEDVELTKGRLVQSFDGDEQKNLIKNMKSMEQIKEIKKIVNFQYDAVLKGVFNDADLKALSMLEKEKIYNAVIFYNPKLENITEKEVRNMVENPQPQFNTREHTQGLAYLSGTIKLSDIDNKHLVRVLKNNGAQQLFIGEAKNNPKVDPELIKNVQKISKQFTEPIENYRAEKMSNYKKVNYAQTTPLEYMSNLFTNNIMAVLYSDRERKRKGLQEVEWDMEKKKRQNNRTGGRSM